MKISDAMSGVKQMNRGMNTSIDTTHRLLVKNKEQKAEIERLNTENALKKCV